MILLGVVCSFEAKEVGGRTQIWQDGDEVRLPSPAFTQHAAACSLHVARHEGDMQPSDEAAPARVILRSRPTHDAAGL